MPSPEPPIDWSESETVDVVARVRLLTTEEGGRAHPLIGSHPYRPNHNFFDADNIVMCVGQLDIVGSGPKYPGDTFECPIRLILPLALANNMRPGREWRIQEGRKLVAEAELVELKARKPMS